MKGFDWREYLNLAKFLLDLKTSEVSKEALYRCAISRAYYSAFCWARNYAQRNLKFKPTGTGRDHRRLVEHLRKTEYKLLATYLRDLRNWRNSSDYDNVIEEDVLKLRAKDSIVFATKIIQTLQ
jgi:uncharacterized protein (UPF0332 family)